VRNSTAGSEGQRFAPPPHLLQVVHFVQILSYLLLRGLPAQVVVSAVIFAATPSISVS
jgi:hypothetical protein